ncbi:MAG: Asp-tRNA(Asn)/Glu-tRNA(Gln) amidotransferase subunit GatC [Legionellales bacterium]
MTIALDDLDTIARLAYLDTDAQHAPKLAEEISAIMDFVAQLSAVNTTNIAPLYHPFALHQRLRPDEVTEDNCLAELEALAPLFEQDLYLVPKVLESGT